MSTQICVRYCARSSHHHIFPWRVKTIRYFSVFNHSLWMASESRLLLPNWGRHNPRACRVPAEQPGSRLNGSFPFPVIRRRRDLHRTRTWPSKKASSVTSGRYMQEISGNHAHQRWKMRIEGCRKTNHILLGFEIDGDFLTIRLPSPKWPMREISRTARCLALVTGLAL